MQNYHKDNPLIYSEDLLGGARRFKFDKEVTFTAVQSGAGRKTINV